MGEITTFGFNHTEHNAATSLMKITTALTAIGFGCYWSWNLSLLTLMLFAEAANFLLGDLLMRLAMIIAMAVLQLVIHLCCAHGLVHDYNFRRIFGWPFVVMCVCALPLFLSLFYTQFVAPVSITLFIVSGGLFGISSGIMLLSWGCIWSVVDRSKPFNRSTAKHVACSFGLAGFLMVFSWYAPNGLSLTIAIGLYIASIILQLIILRQLPKDEHERFEQPVKRLKRFSSSRYMPLFMGIAAGGFLAWVNLALPLPTGLLLVAGGLVLGGILALAIISLLNRIPLLGTIERINIPLIAAAAVGMLYANPPFNYLIILTVSTALTLYFILHWNVLLIMSYKYLLESLDHFSQGAIAPLEGVALGWLVSTLFTVLFADPYRWLLYGVLILLLLTAIVPAIAKYGHDTIATLTLSEAQGLELIVVDDASVSENRVNSPKGSWRSRVLYLAKRHCLSPRETEVFQLLAKGRNAEHIHKELYISIYTAKTHGYRIYRKLGVNSQQELIDMVDSVVVSENGRSTQSGTFFRSAFSDKTL